MPEIEKGTTVDHGGLRRCFTCVSADRDDKHTTWNIRVVEKSAALSTSRS